MTREIQADLAGQFTAASLSPLVLCRIGTAQGDVRMWSGIGSLDYAGEMWLGGGDFLGISDVTETADVQANGVTFSLSGVSPDLVDMALRQIRQGKPAEIFIGSMGDVAVSGAYLVDGTSLHPDAVFSRASAATVINESGEIETVGVDVARFAYDPVTLELRGYLGEVGSLNNFPSPLDISNSSSWAWFRVVWGDLASSKITPDGEYGTHYIEGYIAVTVGVSVAVSFMVTPSGVDFIQAGGGGAKFGQNNYVNFDLVNGVVGSKGSAATGSIEMLSDGRYKCDVVFVPTATGAGANMFFLPISNAAAPRAQNYTGNSVDGVILEYPQAEARNFSTSFIDGARSPDRLSIPLSAVAGYPGGGKPFWLQYKGWTAVGIGSVPQYFGSVDDGTTSNAVWVFRNAGNLIQAYVVAGGVNQAVIDGPSVAGQHFLDIRLRVEAGNFGMAVSVDGGAFVFYGPVSSGVLPTGLTTWHGADRAAHDRAFNGTILGAWMMPWAAKNAELMDPDFDPETARKIIGTGLVGAPLRVFSGKTDVPVISDDGTSCVIGLTAENALVDLERARTRRYTDQDQKAEYSGDLGFEFVPRLQEMEISWGQGLG
ncbi:phage head spike fiber domain-containing protein [Thalassospira sp.]|uniref:phage head spike fiber domain-containing protein n=1 Tax=Thalassospira sp. TaxID=1912094 RepID=UPI003AA7DEAE